MDKDVVAQGGAMNKLQGVGVGLRNQHIDEVLLSKPPVPWFELLIDNHLADGGLIPLQLDAICSEYPVTFHSVGMSLGGTDPLDQHYLAKIKRASDRYAPRMISDHLSFSMQNNRHYHDLLPLPFTEEAVHHLARRIEMVQEILERKILVENVSSYLVFEDADMTEAQFVHALLSEVDCGLLLDINNIHVNVFNHGGDANQFIADLPLHRVQEIHLAGFDHRGDYLLDAHNNPVSQPVWDLYTQVLEKLPDEVPTLIEWDNDIPAFEVLLEEAAKADAISSQFVEGKQCAQV
ncbi:MAG: MNIO family bufferin maturase [bacterium]